MHLKNKKRTSRTGHKSERSMRKSYEPVPLLQEFLEQARSCRCGRIFADPLCWYEHICKGCFDTSKKTPKVQGGLLQRHKQMQVEANRLWPDFFPHPCECDIYNNFDYCLNIKIERHEKAELSYGPTRSDCGTCAKCERILKMPLFVNNVQLLTKAPRYDYCRQRTIWIWVRYISICSINFTS